MVDRRSVCLGAAAALTGASAKAAPDAQLFVSGAMSRNALAFGFKAPSNSLTLPDTLLLSAHGPKKLSQLRGRTYLISLWAEWCAPCLEEATDLAAISRAHDGPSFGVIFVLTGSNKNLDLAGAHTVLAQRGAGDATLFVEPGGGRRIENALASQEFDAQTRTITRQDRGVSLPCNLLVDRHGRVRGRSFGAQSVVVGGNRYVNAAAAGKSHVLTDADKAGLLTGHTLWASPVGSEFAAALAAGVLDKG